MTETIRTTTATTDAARRAYFRPVLILLTTFLGVSVAMMAALVALTAAGVGVDIAIWIRCSFVLASSVTLLIIAVFAARGSRRSLTRLRIIAVVVLAAIVVIVAIPGFLPGWVRIEQAVCGLLVLPVVIMIFLPRIRALFPANA